MFVSVQNTMAVMMVFVLVTCGLVGLAALVGVLLCRVTERRSGLDGQVAFAEGLSPGWRAGYAGREGATAVYCDELWRATGIQEPGLARKTVVEESTHVA